MNETHIKTMKAQHPYVIGRNYLIRTVTFYYTGRLVAVYPNELVIASVSWIPDTGRLSYCLASGETQECEPYPEAAEVVIARSSITDCVPWVHSLPRTQK